MSVHSFSSAQKADLLTGEWREVARHGAFVQDTVFLSFRIGQEFQRLKQNGFAYRGTYRLAGGRIDLSGIQYSLRMKGDTLLLSQEGAESSFVRWMPAVPDGSANTSAGTTNRANQALPANGAAALTSLARAAGKWTVFKRTSAAVQQNIDYRRLIKSITIHEAAGDGSQGYILAGNDAQDAPGWQITALQDGTITLTGRDERRLRVLAFANGELVLEEAPYTYFFKQFND